jgi:hypothetical protein
MASSSIVTRRATAVSLVLCCALVLGVWSHFGVSAGADAGNDGAPGGTLMPAGGENTPPGSPVSVDLLVVQVTFDGVTEGGTTSLTASPANPYGVLPANVLVRGGFYDVATTATWAGGTTVGILYDESAVADEGDLRVFHWVGGRWEDVTARVDAAQNVAYGRVSSLSWFFIGERLVWADDPAPAFANVAAGTLYLAGAVYHTFVTVVTDTSDDCSMCQQVSLETSECSRGVWGGIKWLLMDSVVSWKHWLPPLVDMVGALAFTSTGHG